MESDIHERSSAPEPCPTETVAERIRGRVLLRLARRRRRVLAGRWTAAALLLVAIGLLRSSLDDTSTGTPVPVAERHLSAEPTPRPEPETAAPQPSLEFAMKSGTPREQQRKFWQRCRPLLARGDSLPLEASEELSRFLGAELPRLSAAVRRGIARDLCREIRRRSRHGVPPWIDHLLVHLGRSAVPEAWPILAAVFETAGPHRVAIQAAVDLADPRAVRPLERWLCLGDERSEMVAEAFRVIPGRESLEALLRAARTLRGRGALLLPRVAARVEAALHERQEEICRYLFKAPPAMRPVVTEALVTIGTEEALATMVRALEDRKLYPTARQSLVRVARRDLGPRPEVWQSWLQDETDRWKENS